MFGYSPYSSYPSYASSPFSAYPAYPTRNPNVTPLYPSNRRPQPLYPRASPAYGYQSPDEAAYLRALARERAEREAAARAAYDPFGLSADDEGYYLPRSRHAHPQAQDPYLARRQAEHERQLREREMMNLHLQEQARKKEMQGEAERAQHAGQHQHGQGQKRKSPSPTPTPAPAPAPSPKPEQKQHPEPTQAEVDAATRIQSSYRTHALRKKAHSSLDRLKAKLDTLTAGFRMPEKLEFDLSTTTTSHNAPSDETDIEHTPTNPTPKLLYTAPNTRVHAYEFSLTQLLQELDGVESGGDKEIRARRKEVVRAVEEALKGLEEGVRGVWERMNASVKDEPAVVDQSAEDSSVSAERAEADAEAMDVEATPVPDAEPDEWEHVEHPHQEQDMGGDEREDELEVDDSLPMSAPTPATTLAPDVVEEDDSPDTADIDTVMVDPDQEISPAASSTNGSDENDGPEITTEPALSSHAGSRPRTPPVKGVVEEEEEEEFETASEPEVDDADESVRVKIPADEVEEDAEKTEVEMDDVQDLDGRSVKAKID